MWGGGEARGALDAMNTGHLAFVMLAMDIGSRLNLSDRDEKALS
jgi:hypothetical protein